MILHSQYRFLKIIFTLLLSLIMAFFCRPVAGAWQFDVGGGEALISTAWKGQSSQTMPLPYFSASNGRWRFGPQYGLVQYVVSDAIVELALGLSYRDETYDSSLLLSDKLSDDIVFAGYQDGKGEFTARFQGKYQWFFMKLAQDVSDHSNGLTVLARLEIPLYGDGLGFHAGLNLGAYWQSANYTNYLYGIHGENISPLNGRVAYQTEAALNPFAAIHSRYIFSNSWSVHALYRYEYLDTTIQHSPLVAKDAKQQLAVTVNYRFAL